MNADWDDDRIVAEYHLSRTVYCLIYQTANGYAYHLEQLGDDRWEHMGQQDGFKTQRQARGAARRHWVESRTEGRKWWRTLKWWVPTFAGARKRPDSMRPQEKGESGSRSG